MSDYCRSPPLDQGVVASVDLMGVLSLEKVVLSEPHAVTSSSFSKESGNMKFYMHSFYFILRQGFTM